MQSLLTLIPSVVPGNPERPGDAAAGISKVVSYVAWIALALCVLGVIVAGAMMAIGQRRGEGGEHAARLGWVMAGCIVIGSASAIVGLFT